MAVQLILKNSSVEDKRPIAAQLAAGELALNYNEEGAFLSCKDSAGNIQQVGGVKIAETAPSTPAEQTLWFRPSTKVLSIYDGSNWSDVAVAPGSIVDGDVNASAAIAGTKISPDFGNQTVKGNNITATGSVGIGKSSPQARLDVNGEIRTGAWDRSLTNVEGISMNQFGRISCQKQADGVVFEGYKGNQETSTISANGAATFAGNVLIGGTLPSAPNIKLKANGDITTTGRVGIGTDNPISKFHVADDGGADLRLQDSTSTSATASVLIKAIGSTEMRLQASGGTTAKAMTFYRSSNTEAMVINADGNVGIDKSDPQAKLDVNGEIRTGAWDRSLTNVEGISMNQFGRISCQKQADGVVFEGYKGNQETSTISANGNINTAGDITCTNNSKGLILKSPNGTSFRLSVANNGTLSASAA